jgi:hypothetical protein
MQVQGPWLHTTQTAAPPAAGWLAAGFGSGGGRNDPDEPADGDHSAGGGRDDIDEPGGGDGGEPADGGEPNASSGPGCGGRRCGEKTSGAG